MPTSRRLLLGAFVLVCTAQYAVAEVLAVAAWRGGRYRWAGDYVSELGSPVCDADGCTPLNDLFSASLVVHGVLLVSAALLLAPLAGRGGAAVVRTGFGLGGVGSMVIGLVPLSPDRVDTVHDIGATFAIGGPVLAAVALGLVLLRRPVARPYAAITLACGVVGAVGTGVLLLGGPPGLGERLGVWTFLAWYLGTGVLAARVAVTRGRRAGRPASA